MINWKLIFSFYLTILIPILYLFNIYFAYFYSNTISLSPVLILTGIFFFTIGLAFWIISFYNLRRFFGVLPQKQKRIKVGLYKYFKHPMYIGIFLTFLGLSLANTSEYGLLFLFFVTLPVLILRIIFEEKKLIN